MDDIDRAKALAALEQLEAEKARRLQAKIDSGEVVSVQTTVVVHPDESIEDAQARALARHPVADSDGRAIHRELFFVFTGVPRDPDHWKEENSSPQAAETSASSEEPSRPSEEPDRSEPSYTRSEPTYVRVTIRKRR